MERKFYNDKESAWNTHKWYVRVWDWVKKDRDTTETALWFIVAGVWLNLFV